VACPSEADEVTAAAAGDQQQVGACERATRIKSHARVGRRVGSQWETCGRRWWHAGESKSHGDG
jgi:hypothetical protein